MIKHLRIKFTNFHSCELITRSYLDHLPSSHALSITPLNRFITMTSILNQSTLKMGVGRARSGFSQVTLHRAESGREFQTGTNPAHAHRSSCLSLIVLNLACFVVFGCVVLSPKQCGPDPRPMTSCSYRVGLFVSGRGPWPSLVTPLSMMLRVTFKHISICISTSTWVSYKIGKRLIKKVILLRNLAHFGKIRSFTGFVKGNERNPKSWICELFNSLRKGMILKNFIRFAWW